MTEGAANHLFAAARPAEVFPRFLDRDGQVVAAAILPGLCAGRASRHVIPANPTNLSDMIENSEFATGSASKGNGRPDRGRFSVKFRGYGPAGNEAVELLLAHFSQPI